MLMRFTLALVLVVSGSAAALADPGGCQVHTGPFTSVLVPPPACQSPVGVCTLGQLEGDMPGLYEFTMETLTCGDPTDNDCTYTGVSTVTTDKGVVETLDTGFLTFAGLDPSPFETTAESVDGTGTRRYRNADSVFVATGEINFLTGEASGTYTLEICHAGQ